MRLISNCGDRNEVKVYINSRILLSVCRALLMMALAFYTCMGVADNPDENNGLDDEYKLENVLMSAFNPDGLWFMSGFNSLISPPLSGDSKYEQGETLLTFAAKNKLYSLAKWALSNGSVDAGNTQKENMLSIAIKNKDYRMVKLALDSKPSTDYQDWLTGSDGDNMLSNLLKVKAPIEFWILAMNHGAVLRSEHDRAMIIAHIRGITSPSIVDSDQAFAFQKSHVLKYISTTSQDDPEYTDQVLTAYWSNINTDRRYQGMSHPDKIRDMDEKLLVALEDSSISKEATDRLQINGFTFNQFLVRNNLMESFTYMLLKMDQSELVEAIITPDPDGYNALQYAVRYQNASMIRMLQAFTDQGINSIVPLTSNGVFKGDSPLHVAVKTHAPVEVFRALLDNGADIHQKNAGGVSPRDILRYEKAVPKGFEHIFYDHLNDVRSLFLYY